MIDTFALVLIWNWDCNSLKVFLCKCIHIMQYQINITRWRSHFFRHFQLTYSTDFWHSCTNTLLPRSLTDSETGIWRTPLRNKRKTTDNTKCCERAPIHICKSSYKSVQVQSHFKHCYVPYFLKLSLFGECVIDFGGCKLSENQAVCWWNCYFTQ